PYVNAFIEDLPRLLGWLAHHEQTRDAVNGWMKEQYQGILTSQIRDLTKPETGLHFNISTITAEKMKSITVNKIADVIQCRAPDLWNVVGILMAADPINLRRCEKRREEREIDRKANGGTRKKRRTRVTEEDEDEFHLQEIVNEGEDEPEDIEDLLENERHSLLRVRQVTCISIMMQATSQRCNSLQALVGVFLQSCNVPEQTRNFLAHLGVSVSVATINRAMKQLSREAHREIRQLGASLL
ncbi:hypothetical protein AGABI1DRAFT_13110, partial [Agaricus bisporus var. burnettii JB137-S8]